MDFSNISTTYTTMKNHQNTVSAYPTFSFETTANEVGTVFSQEIKGKNVLVTGTSVGGIGVETAKAIARHANLVIITGYNHDRLQLSEETITEEVPTANIRRLTLDLSSLAAVRKAAAEVNAYSEPLHVLIHNAAATVSTFKLTIDNLENQFATDHVGPFLLTKLLAPKLLAAATPTYTPRVIFVSGAGHAFGQGVDFATLAHPDPAVYNGVQANQQAKSANILTAIELSRRSQGRINAYSLHPGLILTNLFQREEAIRELQAFDIVNADGQPNTEKFRWKTIPQGAATTVTAAFDPRLNDKAGAYLDDSNVANESVAVHSSDPANAQRLWAQTEEIIGEKFTF
ncbi:hypothetical protein DFH08DRAFT_858327 [Mycena albidolilacea]|uniref:Short-chain dehydrogenase/reductase n=1 Tax=Mycena albidolilacea TaxID=1033008 RepID=A0AAD7EWR5_9AGAR|nr:hypothetical protein DFH08DRAFT_858327 [Mycena albidolilacea]